jgi:phosphoglycolate phosphatase
MRRIVMFDYDGVVVDSFAHFFHGFTQTCRRHGYRHLLGREAFLSLFDINLYEAMVQAGIPRATLPEFFQSMGDILRHDPPGYAFFPGMPETLAAISSTSRVLVVTSNVGAAVAAYLDRHAVTCVEAVLGTEQGLSKRDKIRATIAGYPASAYYYVGDTRGDMLEGREGGARTVAVAWGWHPVERMAELAPDHVVRSPAELRALFAAPESAPVETRAKGA